MDRPAVFWLFALGFGLGLFGCRGRSDLVEAELRSREREVRHLKSELYRLEALNHALDQGFSDGRPLVPPGVVPPLVPGPLGTEPVPVGGVADLQIGRPTGGLDEDQIPGDEAVLVVLTPRDADQHAVKAIGTAQVSFFQTSPTGVKLPLGTVDFSAGQLRPTWRPGLLATGYHLRLPFAPLPSYDKVRIVARFTDATGHLFEAEKDISVRLSKMPPPAIAPGPMPVTPNLPPPKPAEQALPGPLVPGVPAPPAPFPVPQGPTLPFDAAKPVYRSVQLLAPVDP